MSLSKLITNAEKIELSDDDIRRIVDDKVNVISYESLFSYGSIDSALGPYNALIVLYEVESHNEGHWSLLYKQNNTLHFFDPLGIAMDEEIDFIPNFYTLDNKGERIPHLTYLVEKSGYKVISNKVKYQKVSEDINTCGRHCCVRLKFRNLDEMQYEKLWRTIPADKEVTELTILYSL